MKKTQEWLQQLLAPGAPAFTGRKELLFQTLAADPSVAAVVQQIQDLQKMVKDKWIILNRIDEILQKPIQVPNGTVGKPYEAPINFVKFGLDDIIYTEFSGLEGTGLYYDNSDEKILGTPTVSGDLPAILHFRIQGEASDSVLNEKKLTIVINPDPKSLWKNIPSNPDSIFAKADDVAVSGSLGEKSIAIASRRGRSHANEGSFRDDDFAWMHHEKNGWSMVAVADGAGSSPFSRQGSKVATAAVQAWFEDLKGMEEFDELLSHYKAGTGEDIARKLNVFIYNTLSSAALYAHNRLADTAASYEKTLKDFHTTLIFTLLKKYDFGYAILSFGVGDCPIAIVHKDLSEVTLMNWLDVGEFGGGTRFITMPEIFSSEKFATRFRFKLIEDFAFLFLMTDGIYDPKFVVEANLEKIEYWRGFIDDLKGNNPDNIAVDFSPQNPDIANQLSQWMEFWSSGNHDDRTLAIIF